MKHLISVLTMLVAGVLLMPTSASAGLVIDNYSSAAAASNAGVTRTSQNATTFFGGQGFLFTGAFSGGSVTYTKNSGTFGDFGSTFSIGVDVGAGDSYLVNVLNQANLIVDSFYVDDATTTLEFSGVNATSATALTFAVSNQKASGAMVLGGGAFTAVPEPTSLALVGLAATGLAFRRRRR